MSRFLIFGILIWMVVLVGAVTWVGSDVTYVVFEDTAYYHNLSANITGFNSDITFAIDTQTDINWTNISGTYSVSAASISAWLSITDSITGNLTINATYDNQTGFFVVPIQAINSTGDDTITDFEFQINATNDAPNFTLSSNYSVPVPNSGNTSLNISLVGSDEEEQYPLEYNVSILGCSLASWSTKGDCNLTSNVVSLSNITSTLAFSNLTYNDAGDYNLTICVNDNINGSALPLYYDSSYVENKSYCQNTTLSLLSSLSVDVTNCTGATVMEGEQFNCTINITTSGDIDVLDFSSLASFRNGDPYTANASWFYANATDSASGFFYSLPISITPTKESVGNWTINFTVDDVTTSDAEVGEILIFVNYTESVVSLDSISNVTLYDNYNFSVNAYDNDLLIQDTSIKSESLFFASNTTWVSAGSASTGSRNNYSTSVIDIDYDTALLSGEGNYSINLSVNDTAGNLDWQVFIVEIINETAPVWNVSLDYPVVLNLTEDVLFTYNVSVNVSDPGETITFYYENVSEEFCSLNATNFNSSGMINFTPVDCDVGFHNVSIVAGNGKLNSSWSFTFNVSNVVDAPSIFSFTGNNGTSETLVEDFNFVVGEGVVVNFSLLIDDDDFLIPSGQRAAYYNESLTIDVTFTNSTGGNVSLFNFSFVEFTTIGQDYLAEYNATFTPGVAEVGNYIVFVNVTDTSGNSTNRTWFLNVTEVLEAPVLGNVSNVSLTIYDSFNFTANATDDEDDYTGSALNYSIVSLDVGAPALTIGITNGSVEFDMNSNASAAGEWSYNISVNDSDGMVDWQVFYLFVYGNASLVSPAVDSVFILVENVSSTLNFTINHSVGDNLTYEFWIDNMSCSFQNNSDCSYGNFSLRELTSSFGNGSVFGWSFTSSFLDETYDNLKNLTVSVYPNATGLNSSQRASIAANFSFKLNISHTNAPIVFSSSMRDVSTTNTQSITYDLSEYFSDADIDDTYYSQNLTLGFLSDSTSNIDANGARIPSNITQSSWSLTFNTGYTAAEFSEVVNVTVYDLNTSNNNITLTSAVSNNFELTFTVPSTTTSSGGSSSTKVKFYSLRIIVPEDVIISDENFIEIPFGLENHAGIDLKGINLTSEVLYNNEFSSDVRIELGETYIDILKAGERRDFSMKIFADTDRSGKYKATVFADIASPKFDDWADFFIDLRKTNESEATELLIFTEKIVAENPECLELTEVLRRAREAFDRGDQDEAVRLAQGVSEACEDAISANEQVKYRIEGFVERNFYYISFLTLMIFFVGLVLYVYKRVRFNKSPRDLYVR